MEQFSAVKRSKDGQPVQYLIVDDSVFARKNLARIIESFGGQVIGEAGDGLTAITEYDRQKPDIVALRSRHKEKRCLIRERESMCIRECCM
jgi:chemotaxis response regulator CheB